MKKILLFSLIMFGAVCAAFAQTPVPLDDAIQSGAREIESKLKQGVKVVVLNFDSPSERFSDYVLDELIASFVNGGKVVVVDRQNLALIQQEMNFQMSGEVSDASAQEIGMKLGAQSIISGNMEDMGNNLVLRLRTIEVVSAVLQAVPRYNIIKDNHTSMLLAGTAAAGVVAAPRAPAAPTGLPHGLNYTTGRKIGAGILNIPAGIGSFTMGDWKGGLIIAGLEVTGIALFAVGTTSVEDGYGNYEYPYNWAGPVGLGVFAGGIIYGFIRPFSYDKALARKNGTYTASSNPMDHIDIALVPDDKKGIAVQMSYSLSF